MIAKAQLAWVRELLEGSQNPVFLYDNDADGLCSYVLLRRWLDRGKGIAVRTHPEIDAGYAHRAQSLGADMVIVLDCPFLGDAFVQELKEAAIPIVWIDHHNVTSPHYTDPYVHVFNPTLGKPARAEPVTFWCYELTQRSEDMWIALMGCIADHYLPPFGKEFAKKSPEFWNKQVRTPFDAYYGTGIGTLAQSLGFGLKDSVSHVVYLQNFLISCLSPDALFAELSSHSSFAEKYKDIRTKYNALLAAALESSYKDLVFYQYSGGLSISSELANELSHRFGGKYILVAYVNAGICTMSLRGKGVKSILEKMLPDFENSTGGGHADAVGGKIRAEDLDRFVEVFRKLLSKRL